MRTQLVRPCPPGALLSRSSPQPLHPRAASAQITRVLLEKSAGKGNQAASLLLNFLEGLVTQKRVGGSWESKVQGCIRGAVLRVQAQ